MQLFQLLTTATLALSALAQQRVTFPSANTQIVGYHYKPSRQNNNARPAPAVIIAHGLGGLQSSRLQPYAERFSQAGYHALTFDYRYWGESSGQPRNLIDVPSQQSDYEAAIAYLQTLPGVDGKRIVLWGTSLSGGHVLQLGARRPDLAAVIVQAPHVNGFATTSALPPADLPSKIVAGLDDAGRATLGQEPLYIPLANRTGQLGALTQAGALEGYAFIQPNPPAPGNVFPARFVLALPFFSPDATAANSQLPTFFAVGLVDNVTPAPAAIALAKRMNATLVEFPSAGHFDVYPGLPAYEENIRRQSEFLKTNVPV
ncbi:hypothetical protein CB0940_01946 [Cercospora beticola]|uniref:Serine aminopeptidase S33 domain-containing protein n=1 Tax=Cercospora beticola TaxID=122368 RepID=A0A2G5I7U8_CERBT|nr:hypothetical protein CB0940_01946 [Cercospora beticola]PIB00849.1 hypothetical protein CB0940_01946 [Cercospora beticola]WPA97410.1 hypothetical protein RHO25_002020 [Cercospora beticola]